MHDTHQIMVHIAELGLQLTNYRALLLLPLVDLAWADGTVEPTERAAILAFGNRNGFTRSDEVTVICNWLDERPTSAYVRAGLDLLLRLTHDDGDLGSAVRQDQVALAIDYCNSVAMTTDSSRLSDIVGSERERLNAIEAEIARLHGKHGPKGGVVGRPLTPTWATLLEELRTRQEFAPR